VGGGGGEGGGESEKHTPLDTRGHPSVNRPQTTVNFHGTARKHPLETRTADSATGFGVHKLWYKSSIFVIFLSDNVTRCCSN